jgi:hypothetical protein
LISNATNSNSASAAPNDPSRRCPDLAEFALFLDDLDDQPHPEQDMIGPADTGSQKLIEAVGGAGEFADGASVAV